MSIASALAPEVSADLNNWARFVTRERSLALVVVPGLK